MRVLVCGGRNYCHYLRFAEAMDALRAEVGEFAEIIHGGAKGADHCAHRYANDAARIPERVFTPDWQAHGLAAGPKRNQQMLDEGKPDLVVAFPGGRGTADMVRRAKASGVRVVEIAA